MSRGSCERDRFQVGRAAARKAKSSGQPRLAMEANDPRNPLKGCEIWTDPNLPDGCFVLVSGDAIHGWRASAESDHRVDGAQAEGER